MDSTGEKSPREYTGRISDIVLSRADSYVHDHSGIMDEDTWRKFTSISLSEEEKIDLIHSLEDDLVNKGCEFIKDIGQKKKGLDMGCGRGGTCMMLADRGYNMVGVTISQQEANFAHEQADRRKGNKPFIICAGYMHVPLRSKEYDFIWMCESIEYAPSLLDALRESCRFTKPLGRMVLIVRTYHSKHEYARRYVERIDEACHINLHSLDEYENAISESDWIIHSRKDLTQDILRFMRFKNTSQVRSGIEPLLIEGYECGALSYHMFWLIKKSH